jgi:hypothetical protein
MANAVEQKTSRGSLNHWAAQLNSFAILTPVHFQIIILVYTSAFQNMFSLKINILYPFIFTCPMRSARQTKLQAMPKNSYFRRDV